MKKKIRQTFCLMLTMLITLSSTLPVYATEANDKVNAPTPYGNTAISYRNNSSNITEQEIVAAAADGLTIIEKITDPIVIQQMVLEGLADADENGNFPISIITYRTSETNCDYDNYSNDILRAAGISVTKTNYYDGQYFDEYDRYVVDGPAEFETTYTKRGTRNWNTSMSSDVTVGGNVYKVADVKAAVSSKVGYSFGVAEEETQRYTVNIPDGKYWEIKVWVSYLVHEYTASIGSVTLATGKTWRPNGLVIRKTEYNQ